MRKIKIEASENARAYPVVRRVWASPDPAKREQGLPSHERARPKKLVRQTKDKEKIKKKRKNRKEKIKKKNSQKCTEKSKVKKKGLRVGTLNVGSLTGKWKELVDLIERRRIGVLCIQETRWKGNKTKDLGRGYKLYYSGGRNRNGVGIVVSKELKDKVVDIKRNGDRIMSIKLCLDEKVNIVCAYAPQVGCDLEEKDEFWRNLQEQISVISQEERVMIGADLNGHIGKERGVLERVHGGWGIGERNDEGEKVIDFAMSFDMAICNTFFQKAEHQYVTYMSGGRRSQIDFLMCRRKHLKEVTNCKVIYGEHVAAQHKLVVVDSEITVKKRKIQQRTAPKIKWWKLKDDELKRKFKERVQERMSTTDCVQNWWEINSSEIKKAGKEILGVTSGKGPPPDKETWWWSDEVRQVIKRKKEARKSWELARTTENKNRFREANKEAKKVVARAKARAMNEVYNELETPEGEMKIYKIAKARNKATKDFTHIRQIKDGNGEILTEDENIRNRWKCYFEKLLNEENPRVVVGDGVPSQGVVPEISKDEIQYALRKMKNDKSTGPDNIPVEVWKSLGDVGINMLWDLMNKIFKEEKMPDEWRDSILVPIYKEKGDIQDCANYRGIKLMSHTMKIWERIIDRRLRQETEIGAEQFGFMPGRSTTDAVFALRQIMERHRERRRGIHLIFIDLEKAYDRVPRQEVWRCMREKKIPEKYIRLVQDMYEGARTQVRSCVGVTIWFPVKVGLHQGSALSPYLFALIMDILSEGVKDQAPWCMLFADDIVLCSTNGHELERKAENWRRALEDRGLKISRKKTEYLTSCEDGNHEIRLQDELLKRVQHFRYLGSTVAENGELDAEITHRIQSGWRNWKNMSGVLCDRRINAKVKGKVYKTVVRPAMLYGSETWPTKRAQEEKMNVAEMKMLRWMCGVTRLDKIRNDRIRGTVKVTKISKKIQERRLQWYGHVKRRDAEYVGNRVLEMRVDGTRGRGRPKRRWMDGVREDMEEKNLREDQVNDRNLWKRLARNVDPV